MTIGYSGKTLYQKLGLKDGLIAVVVNKPEQYESLMGKSVNILPVRSISERDDWIHVFVSDREQLIDFVNKSLMLLRKNVVLWISWPKKTAGVKTDLSEDFLREVMLPVGMVDVKVIAVDATWSGLKFVWRKENR